MEGHVKPRATRNKALRGPNVKRSIARTAKDDAVRTGSAGHTNDPLHLCQLGVAIGKVSPTGPHHHHHGATQAMHKLNRLGNHLVCWRDSPNGKVIAKLDALRSGPQCLSHTHKFLGTKLSQHISLLVLTRGGPWVCHG